MGNFSNIWLNIRISVKHVARRDVFNKGFEISMPQEECINSIMCVYGLDQEEMNSQLLRQTTLNLKGFPLS